MKLKKSKRTIKYIAVHCTATIEGEHFDVKDVDRWHRHRGFSGIGYNYLIPINGGVQEGRDVDRIPAHVKGFNRNSIGVVYVGGYDSLGRVKDTRTFAQKRDLLMLLKQLKKMHPQAIIKGHRDFPRVNKACPCFDAEIEYKNL